MRKVRCDTAFDRVGEFLPSGFSHEVPLDMYSGGGEREREHIPTNTHIAITIHQPSKSAQRRGSRLFSRRNGKKRATKGRHTQIARHASSAPKHKYDETRRQQSTWNGRTGPFSLIAQLPLAPHLSRGQTRTRASSPAVAQVASSPRTTIALMRR